MIRPLITAAALALALGLYFAGYLSPDGLVAALAFAGLPGADALVRALRQRGEGVADPALVQRLQRPIPPDLVEKLAQDVEQLAREMRERTALEMGPDGFPAWGDLSEAKREGARAVARLLLENGYKPPAVPGATDNRPPPTPIPAIGRLTRVPLLLLLPLLALGCANIERRNAAREVFMQAQEQQTAALRDLQTLSATHQAALLRLPAGPAAVKAVADFRARRQQTVDLSSKAAEAARAAQVELGLRGPPEGLEALARAAGAAAGALVDDLAALKRYAAQQLQAAGGGQ